MVGVLEIVHHHDRGAHRRHGAHQRGHAFEKALAAARELGGLGSLGCSAMLEPQGVTAAGTTERGALGDEGLPDLLEKAHGLAGNGRKGPESHARFAAPLEHHAAAQAHLAAQGRQQPRFADAGRPGEHGKLCARAVFRFTMPLEQLRKLCLAAHATHVCWRLTHARTLRSGDLTLPAKRRSENRSRGEQACRFLVTLESARSGRLPNRISKPRAAAYTHDSQRETGCKRSHFGEPSIRQRGPRSFPNGARQLFDDRQACA